jgi:hypothetical protein
MARMALGDVVRIPDMSGKISDMSGVDLFRTSDIPLKGECPMSEINERPKRRMADVRNWLVEVTR